MLKSSSSMSSTTSSSASSITASSPSDTGAERHRREIHRTSGEKEKTGGAVHQEAVLDGSASAVAEGECVYRIPDNSGEFRVLDLIDGGPFVIQELFLSRSFGEVDGSVE